MAEDGTPERVAYERVWQRLRLGTRLYWVGVGMSSALGILLINLPLGPVPPVPPALLVALILAAFSVVGVLYVLHLRSTQVPKMQACLCRDDSETALLF